VSKARGLPRGFELFLAFTTKYLAGCRRSIYIAFTTETQGESHERIRGQECPSPGRQPGDRRGDCAPFRSESAKTAFTYLGSAKAAEALAAETGAEAIPADSADRATLVKTVADRGALDVIVISAGALVMGDPLTLDADAVDGLIDVNVRAPYHAAVEAARRMNPGGRIIVIGSTNGDRIPFAGGSAYALSKSAMQGMVRGLARDFGPRGITVNAIQPGPTDSDMNPARRPDGGDDA